MKRAFLLIVILSVAAESVPAADPLNQVDRDAKFATPREVLALKSTRGSHDALESLIKTRKWQSSVLPGVRSGEVGWVEVARVLYPSTDAGVREDLDVALTGALLKAPYRVLPLLKTVWWNQSDLACTFDYDSELPGGTEAYVQHLRASLQKEPPPKLARLREECIHGIGETLEALQVNKATK